MASDDIAMLGVHRVGAIDVVYSDVGASIFHRRATNDFLVRPVRQ